MRQMLIRCVVAATLATTFAACGGKDVPGTEPGNGSGDGSGASEPGSSAAPVIAKLADVKLAGNATAYLGHLAKLAAAAENAGEATVVGRGAEVLLTKELRSLSAGPFWGEAAQTASRAPKPSRRDPLPAIVAYHEQLAAAGIDWVFVPVPAKVAVDPTLVPGAPKVDGRIDVHCVAFYALLRKAGVPVLDVVPALQAMVAGGKRAHCQTDSHWTPAACEVVAGLIAQQATSKPWFAKLEKHEYEQSPKQISVTGDLAAMRKAVTPPESLSLHVVTGPKTSDAAPVLLFGDSHCLVFHSGGDMHAKGAGLADHLMLELKTPISVLGVRGSGATPSRVDALRGKRFDGKRFAIWCLTAREFTEGQGWAKVPLQR